MGRRSIVAALLLALAGCGRYIHVEVDSSTYERPAWVDAPDLRDRTVAAAEIAARSWGGSLPDRLVIRFVPLMRGRMGQTQVSGVTRWDAETDVAISWIGRPCVESTVLFHEVGHAVGLEDHSAAQWCSSAFWNVAAMTVSAALPASEPDPERCSDAVAERFAHDNLEQSYCDGRPCGDEGDSDARGAMRAAGESAFGCDP